MHSHVLSIDQGTTGTTCMLVRYSDGGCTVLSRASRELPQHFPQAGWVEHDLREIWATVQSAAQACLTAAAVAPASLAAIGITNQRETVCVWDRSGKPLHRAIVWQDRRTADLCGRLRDEGHTKLVADTCGLVIDPYFSGTKILWLLETLPHLRQRAATGEVLFGTVDSWLTYCLTGGAAHVTDATNASRTMLYDIHKGAYDENLCALLGAIPIAALPRVLPNCGLFGKTLGCGFVPDGIPITGAAGDQQAALIGQACLQPGQAKCTYGTGAFALINTGSQCRQSTQGLLSTIAYAIGGEVTYALEGSVFVAGAVVQWLRDGLHMFKSSAEIEALAAQVDDCDGVVVVPALVGLGAPHWKPQARGMIAGITRGTTRAHIARASLEGIAFQVYDLLAAMRQDSGAPISDLRVDGGAAANNLLMQFQADLLGIQTHRPKQVETTALGAAHLAALGVGIFADLSDMTQLWQCEHTFRPGSSPQAVQAHLARWHGALQRL